jgi:hypothetical protein
MSVNRRKHPRLALDSKVTVTMNDVILEGTTIKNISSGGMCIAVRDRIDKFEDGMLILIYRCHEDVLFFKADFSVSWNSILSPDKYNAELGILFKNLEPTSRNILEKILLHSSGGAS